MDPLLLASMTGDFLTVLLSLEDELDLCSVLRPDNVMILEQHIQLRETLPTEAFVPVSGFAAPEQYVAGNCERAPVYFIGALMYTLLYGKPPADVRNRLSDGVSVEMSTTVLSTVITRCLELYPGDRYADLRQVLFELNAILEANSETENVSESTGNFAIKELVIDVIEEADEGKITEKKNEKPAQKTKINQEISDENKDISSFDIPLDEEKKPWKFGQKKLIISVCAGVLVCGFLGYSLWQSQRTETALETGEYSVAVESLTFAPWLRLTRSDAYHYATAQVLWEEGRFDEAQAIFVDISDYADSAALIDQIQYDKGVSLANALQLEEAKLVFDSLGDYGDSATQSQKIDTYQQASALEDPAARYTAFLGLGDYLNSSQMAEEIAGEVYQSAQNSYEAEDFVQAGTLFTLLNTYQDAAIYKQLCDIWQAASDDAAENRAGLSAVMAYSEVANLEPVVMSDRFFMIFLEGNWTSSDGGGDMSFEADTFSAPLLDIADENWIFDTRSIHDDETTVATFEYVSPNEVIMTVSETGEAFHYQRII